MATEYVQGEKLEALQSWICDYCNDASFTSFLQATKHERICSGNHQSCAFSLSIQEDGKNLSDRQCFIRSHCIEAFVVNASHWCLIKGSTKPNVGQVGLRCKFCSDKPSPQRADRSMCFPSSLSRLYQAVADMQRFHFPHCTSIPSDMMMIYMNKKATRPRGQGSPQSYWVEAAKILHLTDSTIGITILKNNWLTHVSTHQPSSNQTSESMMYPESREGFEVESTRNHDKREGKGDYLTKAEVNSTPIDDSDVPLILLSLKRKTGVIHKVVSKKLKEVKERVNNGKLLELAEFFRYTIVSKEGDHVKLEDDHIYLVAEGELELSAIIPTLDVKNENRGYLCRKKAGDILSKRSANKQAKRNMSPQMKKLESFMDDLEIIAKTDSILVYAEACHLQQPELLGPLTKILDTPIQDYLANVPFLSHVKESKLSVLAAMCRYESFDKGEIIFEENTVGTNLYMILYGAVQVIKSESGDNASHHSQKRAVATLKEGNYFGETALLTNLPRTCTTISMSKSLFITVEQQVFKNFLSVCPVGDEILRTMKERIFCNLSTLGIPLLDGIPPDQLESLSQSVSLEELEKDDIIFHEGDPGDNFYIIICGEVKVETIDSLCKKRLGILGAGKYFGEMALVTDSPRTATVTATTKTLLLRVSKESFFSIFSTKQAMAEFQLRLLRQKTDLKYILMHSTGVKAFRRFLEGRLAQENIDFWLSVEEYQNLKDDEHLEQQAIKLFEVYCDEGAESQVNMPCAMRNFIQAEILKKRFDASLFDLAKNEIYELMKKDHFTKFKNTTEYFDVLKSLGLLF